MADIQTYLDQIKNAQYGKDVRQSIHDGIKQCYEDGKAGAIDLTAREDIKALNSALDDRRTYCIDSGYAPRVELNMPAGTCALVCIEYGFYYVASLSTNYLIVPIFLSQDIPEADRPIIIPYVDQRMIAIRRAENTSQNVRVLVITPFSTITKR